MSSHRNLALASITVKLAIFVAASLVLTVVVVASLLDLDTSKSHTYKAVFTDSSALQNGDAVRMAGVKVGRVSSVGLSRDQAVVNFTVDSSQLVTTTSQARVDYENLFGQRNLTLTAGAGGPRLRPGSTIPITQTQPALDLTDLFIGFQPLYQALTPSQINTLTANIIGAFQGQSTNVAGLVTQTANLTNNLADRQAVIDHVVDNLNGLLTTVGAHDAQVGQFIDSFATLATNLAGDRGQISTAIDSASTLTASLSNLVGQVQPPLQSSIANLTGVTAAVARSQGSLDQALTKLPGTFDHLATIFQNGTYSNVYLCQLDVIVHKPLQLVPFQVPASVTTLLTSVSNVIAALYPPIKTPPGNGPGVPGQVGPLPSLGVLVPNGATGNPNLHTPNCKS